MSDSTVLADARDAVAKGRAKYGGQLDGFVLTARHWSALFGIPIGAEQVAMAMLLNKCARETMLHNDDNLVDIAGYAQVIEDIRRESAERARFVQSAQQTMTLPDLVSATLLANRFEREAAEKEIVSRAIQNNAENSK